MCFFELFVLTYIAAISLLIVVGYYKIPFVREGFEKDLYEPLFYFFSFTLLLASYTKNYKKEDKVSLIKMFNRIYFLITLSFIAILIHKPNLCFLNHLNYDDEVSFKFFACSVLFIYAIFRVNEIFYAFINDAMDKLKPQKISSGLKFYDRIKLAMVSYVELILLYGMLQFVLSVYGFGIMDYDKANIGDAIYFSGITIATVGYGDLLPQSSLSKLLSVYEVINGIVLIVVSFTIYVSQSIVNKEYEE